jgi:hypothetical protein
MIGATPAFYDQELEAQPPQPQDYHSWANSFGQHQLGLPGASSYVHPPSTTDSHPHPQPQSQQPTTRHHNQYQFVPQNPLPTTSDATQYGYFPIPTQFDNQSAQTLRRPRGSQPIQSQDWSQPTGPVYPQLPTSDDPFPDFISQPVGYPDPSQAQHQHQQQSTGHLTPQLVATPLSETTSRISPSWVNNTLPSPGGSSTTPTIIVHPRFNKRGEKSSPSKSRKRQKPETDDDDDDDVVGANLDANVPRPNRLPGACTYCKRLKMKCYFPPGENVCKRCRSGKHDCIVEGRKPRSAPNKREYLLAQMRQKDELIESLLKQLHNPYLATPLSIEAYRMATPTADQHRQEVIAWLDRLQSSVRSPPVRSSTGPIPFQLDVLAGKGGGQSDESDEEPSLRKHVQPRRASSGSEDTPVSPNTLVESDIDLYPDDAVPIGLLAKLAISTSRDTAGGAADKTHKESATADDDDVGVANKMFFMPGPALNLGLRKSLIDKTSPPDILVHKLVTPDDVEKLFDIYYTRINVRSHMGMWKASLTRGITFFVAFHITACARIAHPGDDLFPLSILVHCRLRDCITLLA